MNYSHTRQVAGLELETKTLRPMITVPVDFGEDLKAEVLAVNLLGLN